MEEISQTSIRFATLKTVLVGLCLALLMTIGFTGGSWYLIALSTPGVLVLLPLAWFASGTIFYFFGIRSYLYTFVLFFSEFVYLFFPLLQEL